MPLGSPVRRNGLYRLQINRLNTCHRNQHHDLAHLSIHLTNNPSIKDLHLQSNLARCSMVLLIPTIVSLLLHPHLRNQVTRQWSLSSPPR